MRGELFFLRNFDGSIGGSTLVVVPFKIGKNPLFFPVCGISIKVCGNEGESCGISTKICGNEGHICGISKKGYGNEGHICEISKKSYGIARYSCGISENSCEFEKYSREILKKTAEFTGIFAVFKQKSIGIDESKKYGPNL